nr:TetR/AcrR family transcriptional regulator [Streptomyces sp. HNM0574]
MDAAGELLLAWGYRRVTIDEVARRAKVGKGTVYLHWRTKDALLLAVVLRRKLEGQRRQLTRVRRDPREALPSRMMRGAYLDIVEDPVLRALHLVDADVLGKLNDVAHRELAALMGEGQRALERYFTLLRGHGLVRDEGDVARQCYLCTATTTGFITSEGLLGKDAPFDPQTRAGLLEQTLRAALETSAEPRPERMAEAAREVVALFGHVEELCLAELRRQVRA